MGLEILVICDHQEGRVRPTAFEATSAAVRLVEEAGGGQVTALVIGRGVAENAKELGVYGANRALVVEDERLETYVPAAYRAAAQAAIEATNPALVLLSVNADNRDLAARIAARAETSVLADCTEIKWENGQPVALRPAFAGKVNLRVTTADTPAVASLRPRMFEVQGGGSPLAEVEALEVALDDSMFWFEVLEFQKSEGKQVDLTEADRIVSGGRGLQAPEHFGMIEEFASVVGATVGASRAVVDAGWRPHEDQVGQTGKTVTPSLYFAFGISGAIQHLAGMSRSKVIVAVNKDSEAPIFEVADYGIVGDVFEVVPALTEEAKKLLAAD